MEKKKTIRSQNMPRQTRAEKGWQLNEDGMPPARVLAAERAREEAFMRALEAEDDGSCSGSESEATLVEALATLRVPPTRATPIALPDAAALVARFSTALPKRETTFLDEYLRILNSRNESHIRTITDELMRGVEQMLETESGAAVRAGRGGVHADGVVLAGWLACALLWRAPRIPAAPRALHAVARLLPANQVEELARALHESIPSAADLMLVSDVVRGAAARAGTLAGPRPVVAGAGAVGSPGGAGGEARAWALAGGEEAGGAALLTELLLRAALARIANVATVSWCAGPLSVQETTDAVSGCWSSLELSQQLAAARLAGRVLARAAAAGRGGEGAGGAGGAEGEAAARLLAALAHPPPPHLRHHPDYIKMVIALTKLEVLFKPADEKSGATAKKNKKTNK